MSRTKGSPRTFLMLALAGLAEGAWLQAVSAPLPEAPTTDGNALVAAQAGGAARDCAKLSEDARAVLQKYVDEKAVAGAISLISVSGRVEAAYVGLADPGTGRKMDAQSFFWIASMSKGFCGAAVMACVDRGLLALDDPVEKYIPAMRNVRIGAKGADGRVTRVPTSRKMTLRMCLAHVAGYAFHTPEVAARGSDRTSLAEKAETAATFPLLRDVETKHQYSNTDIDLAARCVEVVTGRRYEDFLQETFFGPLGMTSATFFPTKEQFAHRVFVSRVKKGAPYEDGNGDHWAAMLKDAKTTREGRFASASGGLYATAGDVMKFYMMLANDGKAPDGTRILSHASIVQLSTAQYPKLDRYTLGLRQYGDWFGHDGALQTEAYANWKENRAALLYVQVTGAWDHPFKLDWRRVAMAKTERALNVFNLDSTHYTGGEFGDDKMNADGLRAYIHRILGAGAFTHFLICPGAQTTLCDTKTLSPSWWRMGEPGVPTNNIMRRDYMMFTNGVDVIQVEIDAIRAHGVSPWLTMRMNDNHEANNPKSWLHSKFWVDHPEYRKHGGFNYSIAAVRDYHLAFVGEMLERYDVDGFECDWMRWPIAQDADVLTAFMRRVRALVDAAAKRRGHAILLGVRVASRPEQSRRNGTDAILWAKEGLVDWIVPANFFGSVDFDLPVDKWLADVAAAGSSARVIPGLDTGVKTRNAATGAVSARRMLTLAEYCGWAKRMYERGAPGVYFFNLFTYFEAPYHVTDHAPWNFIVSHGLTPASIRDQPTSIPSNWWYER